MHRRTTTTVLLGATLLAGLAAPVTSAAGAPTGDQAKARKLADYVPVQRALPGPAGHAYRFATRTSYWSVVAVDPAGIADVDLAVWDDAKHTDVLAESDLAAGLLDFVAIDGNHREGDKLYPEVTRHSGTGTYTVQLAQGQDSIIGGQQTVPFAGSDVVRVRDTLLVEGNTYRFTLTPDDDGLRGALYVMDSLPLTIDTWVKSKSEATASAFAPAGQPVVLEITSHRTDWYGLVIPKDAGAGAFTLEMEQVESR